MTFKSIDELSDRGDSYTEYPTYIKHWEEATFEGWKIKILTESGLHIFNCKWKEYKRPHDISKKDSCPHN